MNKYELALVVDTKIDDEVKNSVVQKAKDLIAKLGGTVTNVDEWGKKKLAYEIEKRTEGFYYFIQFDAEPTVPAGMEQDLRIMDNVLRYLVVRQEA
ncbi:MAG: 30S ribosomal protein S6 [Lachnospiraceae bacterium]|nr:30S ribosomal protein S6 [Lachnospiraceae bacterium]MEE3460365.1 30S ribosomal protein S6 [Lachnospiraceae bacterium]